MPPRPTSFAAFFFLNRFSSSSSSFTLLVFKEADRGVDNSPTSMSSSDACPASCFCLCFFYCFCCCAFSFVAVAISVAFHLTFLLASVIVFVVEVVPSVALPAAPCGGNLALVLRANTLAPICKVFRASSMVSLLTPINFRLFFPTFFFFLSGKHKRQIH